MSSREAYLEARIAMLERQVAQMMRRTGTPFALARSTLAPIDAGPIQTVQGRLDALSTRDAMPVLYHYGFTANLPIGADKLVAFLDGDRSKAVVIATGHQQYRLRGLGVGDSALYDSRGATIWLTSAGPAINGAGNPTLVTGDLHVTGQVIAGFGGTDQVTLQHHTHNHGLPPDAGT